MSTLDVFTEDWTLWRVVIQSPGQGPLEIKVRAPQQTEAGEKALRHRDATWTVATDEYGNPCIHREETRHE